MRQSNRLQVGVIGCGIVGAAIAYELSQVPELAVTVLDRRPPEAWAATGAALGVLMGAISQKKGNNLRMRLASLKRYETLVPELEDIVGRRIPFNRQGILRLCFNLEELDSWQKAVKIRCSQGFQLEILDTAEVTARYPEISQATSAQPLVGAIYSPQDRQVDPVALTQALVEAAQQQGVCFHFQTMVQGFRRTAEEPRQVEQIQTNVGELSVDWLVLASGLGSTLLTDKLEQRVEVQPVLGQALHLRRRQPLKDLRPVISGADVHLVPLSPTELWVGATVEFPTNEINNQEVLPNSEQLAAVFQQAIALCPTLAEATILRTWSGLRPRPQNRSAPVVEPLSGYRNVLLATGHYRNGVLLAPATAQKIRELISTQI